MGIKGLLPFLKSKCTLKPIDRMWPANSVAAIDVPIFAHKFIYSEKTYEGLERRFHKFGQELREQRLEPIFCFDGGRLDIKAEERQKRCVARDRQMVRNVQKRSEEIEAIFALGISIKRSFSVMSDNSAEAAVEAVKAVEAVEAVEAMKAVKAVEAVEAPETDKLEVVEISPADIPDLIAADVQAVPADVLPDVPAIFAVEREVPEYFEGILKPTTKDYETLYEFLEAAGFKCRRAQYEAEALCAHLVCTSEAWCAITEDTDAIAFGSPRTIYKLFQDPIMVDLQSILKELEMTQEQFVDLCCMLGCDFCDNVYKVGPETAYKLIKAHGSWANVFDVMRSQWPPKTRESADVFNVRYAKAVECLKKRAFEIQ